ncbi:hypothetical protein IFR05_017251, partial [Cadophora sp. M221]
MSSSCTCTRPLQHLRVKKLLDRVDIWNSILQPACDALFSDEEILGERKRLLQAFGPIKINVEDSGMCLSSSQSEILLGVLAAALPAKDKIDTNAEESMIVNAPKDSNPTIETPGTFSRDNSLAIQPFTTNWLNP